MRRRLFPALYVIFSLGIILTLGASLPKYAGMLLFFTGFLLLDGILWFRLRDHLRTRRRFSRSMVAGLFWLPHLLLYATIAASFIHPFLRWSIPFRTFLQTLILILFLVHLIPQAILLIAWIVYGVRHIRDFLFRGTSTQEGRHLPIRLQQTGWTLGTIVFLLMMAGTFVWQYDFRVRRVSLPVRDLPLSFDGLRIAQISDIHLGSWISKRRLQEAVNRVNEMDPDLVFFTGDMFNFSTAEGDEFLPVLKTLRAPLGVIAVAGNHDYGDYIRWPSPDAKRQNMDQFLDFYRRLGWTLLMNDHVYVKRGNDSILVAGIENWGATRRFQRLGDLRRALDTSDTAGVQLLLSHDPSYWDSVVRKKYRWIDITFSGHTHGGQVGWDAADCRWSPVAWFSNSWIGLYRDTLTGAPCYLYVNPGLGTIGYAGRIGILPEISLFTLRTPPRPLP